MSTIFSVGKTYTMKTWEGSEDGGLVTDRPNCVVIEFQFPLLKVRQHGKELIFNTASPAFAGAEPEKPS